MYTLTNQALAVGFCYPSYSMDKDNPEIEVVFPRVSGTEEVVASALLTPRVGIVWLFTLGSDSFQDRGPNI